MARSNNRNVKRRSSGRFGDQPNRKKRSAFTKLLKDKDAEMRDAYQAKRFLEGMETFDSKAELLSELDNPRNEGKRRLRDLLSFINSTEDVELLLIPLLRQVMNDETKRPMYRPLLNKMLLEIYHTPMLMNVIQERSVVDQFSSPSAQQFCSFLRALTKPYIEPRQSETVQSLAKALQERGDVHEARTLCSFLLLDETQAHAAAPFVDSGKPRPTACWVTDMEPPGGRHDNDHFNYRDIRLVPTVEELTCEAKPYLPLASGENSFIKNDHVAALLDRNFRLLREDAVSSMRTNISESETKCWKNARIIDIHVSTRRPRWSVSFVIQCDGKSGRVTNWKRSRAFMIGSLVALCRNGHPVRMGTVALREDSVRGEWLNHPSGPKFGVLFESEGEFSDSIKEMVKNCEWNASYCKLMGELAELGRNNPYRYVLDQQIQVCTTQMEVYDLVEVSKSFFSYQPILKTLQQMDSIPLSDELTGSSNASSPPEYLPEEITLPEKDFGGLKCRLKDFSVDDIVRQTSLDRSQAEALKHTFSSNVVLTQGPPGTGKTFIGALVARIIRMNTDESILCVCHTNHALDQFLEHLLMMGETRIARMGGRSKSAHLARYQLRELARTKSQSNTTCQKRIKQVHAHLHKARENIEGVIEELKTPLGWRQLEDFLMQEYPKECSFLTVPTAKDDDGFQLVFRGGKKLKKDLLWDSWQKGESFPIELVPHMRITPDLAQDFDAFWNLSMDRRAQLIDEWRQDILGSNCDTLTELIEDFNVHGAEDKSLCREGELEVLRSARIIGATTAGAALHHDLLSTKAAGVIMVEEAGEVLESHVLTALAGGASEGQSSKHLILIGDHKQLPPKVENYALTTTSGKGLNLDCSLFERLIYARRPSVALEVQHRMRPTISALIRSQTYPLLRDHASVSRYPDVRGVSENLLFIDHDTPEDGADEDNTTTKSNQYEANLCVEIVRLLLLQGYKTDQIVVLTPYLGQLLTIMQKMKALRDVEAIVSERDMEDLDDLDDLEIEGSDPRPGSASSSTSDREKKGVRCSSIDNYQGEESDLVVISLVRSNKQGNIGFMKEKQRVNVLLSRARYGMFLVGSTSTLLNSRKGSSVWTPLLQQFEAAGRIRKGLPTTCQLHPNDDPILLCQPADFRGYRPNGGCLRPCRYRLNCGHACPLMCHPTDRRHVSAQRNCCEPCRRFPPECKRNHPCPKLCKDDCGPCQAPVDCIPLTCGHIAARARCHDVRSEAAIVQLSSRCQARVDHRFACGHTAETTCSNSKSDTPVCPELCGARLACNHRCTNKCGQCNGAHQCGNTCERTLFCGHVCGRPCHEGSQCPPCQKPCHSRCQHSRCNKKCAFPCSSCVEPCDWQCEHRGRCPLVCGAPCSRLPCNQRCTKLLSCGHRCPSVCGEDCPPKSFCQKCGRDDHLNQIVDMISLSSYAEHDPNEDPLIFLPCGHFYTMSSMDGVFGLQNVYQKNSEGDYIGIAPRGGDVSEKAKACPDCRSIVHSLRRYGRILRLIEIRGLERKHLAKVDKALAMNEGRIRSALAQAPTVTTAGGIARDQQQMLEHLAAVEKLVQQSPMKKVFEACGGSNLVESVSPPAKPLIRCHQLRGDVYGHWAAQYKDDNYCDSEAAYLKAMEIADGSKSHRTGAQLRLGLARLMLKHTDISSIERIRKDVNVLFDWIVQESGLHAEHELVLDAQKLQRELRQRNDLNTLRSVMSAMNKIDGYDYGGSASAHWYECPNGHPYFIGECGGAMQTSRCIECGATVGGGSHTLIGGNQHVTGVYRDALSSSRR